jgi:hypothetical protein
MGARATGRPSFRAVSDAAAILVFVTIGLLSHRGDLSLRGYARDALPFLGCWFAAAFAFGLYARGGPGRLAATWAVGVPAAVLVRALVLGRPLGGKELAFLLVSLLTIGVLVVVFRALLTLLESQLRRAAP